MMTIDTEPEPNDEERRIASIPIHRMRLQAIVDYRMWILESVQKKEEEQLPEAKL